MKILVADDDAQLQRALRITLASRGYDVVAARDGAEAIELAASAHADLVLLDLGMPGLNGLDTCRRLRAAPGGAAIQIVAVTGWGQDEDRRRTEDAGFDAHLVKPVGLDTLEAVLGDLG